MKTDPYLAARLLSQKNELSVLEKEKILAEVMHHPSVTGKSSESRGASVSANKQHTWVRAAVIWTTMATAAATAIFLLVVTPSATDHPSGEQHPPAVRWMGNQAAVEAFLHRDGKTFRLDGQRLLTGDHIRFKVTAPSGKNGYASVVGIEGNQVIPLIPSKNEDPAVTVKDATLLPGSVAITPGSEPVQLLLVFRATGYAQKDLIAEVRENLPWKPGKKGVKGVVLELPIDPQPRVKK